MIVGALIKDKDIMNNDRVKYIDIAKGIGIILVICGHILNGGVLQAAIVSMHMPYFFIISGLLFKEGVSLDKKKLFKRLIVPYFITGGCFILYFFLKHDYVSSKNWVWGIIYGSGYDYDTPYFIKGVGGLWFLLALFWGELLLNDILKLKEDVFRWLCVIGIAFVGVYTYQLFCFPWDFQQGMLALLYLYVGLEFKKNGVLEKNTPFWIIICICIWIICAIKTVTLSFVNLKGVNGAYITSVFSSLALLKVCVIIDKTYHNEKVLCWIGRNSLVALCAHIFEIHSGILVGIRTMIQSNMPFFWGEFLSVLISILWCIIIIWLYEHLICLFNTMKFNNK